MQIFSEYIHVLNIKYCIILNKIASNQRNDGQVLCCIQKYCILYESARFLFGA